VPDAVPPVPTGPMAGAGGRILVEGEAVHHDALNCLGQVGGCGQGSVAVGTGGIAQDETAQHRAGGEGCCGGGRDATGCSAGRETLGPGRRSEWILWHVRSLYAPATQTAPLS
jgi:hypothetical protein